MKKNKFRVWVKKHNLMFDIITICFDLKEVVVEHDVDGLGYWTYSFDEVIIMQQIGLEDLNNKEAYEDDLIGYKYYHENGEKVIGIGKIYFDGGCYFLEDVKTKHKYPMYLAGLSFKIKGNIYQNKNLL